MLPNDSRMQPLSIQITENTTDGVKMSLNPPTTPAKKTMHVQTPGLVKRGSTHLKMSVVSISDTSNTKSCITSIGNFGATLGLGKKMVGAYQF